MKAYYKEDTIGVTLRRMANGLKLTMIRSRNLTHNNLRLKLQPKAIEMLIFYFTLHSTVEMIIF